MTVQHNDPDNFIDDPEYFLQYYSWRLSEHEGGNIQTIPTQVNNKILDGG